MEGSLQEDMGLSPVPLQGLRMDEEFVGAGF